jgi:predicted RNA-binding protein YlxR (DUF448 family)
MKAEPERMCVGCRQKNGKNTLIRVVNNKSEISVDSGGKSHGRGAYIHSDSGCLKTAIKKRSLDRALKHKIPDEIYKELEVKINEQQR